MLQLGHCVHCRHCGDSLDGTHRHTVWLFVCLSVRLMEPGYTGTWLTRPSTLNDSESGKVDHSRPRRKSQRKQGVEGIRVGVAAVS